MRKGRATVLRLHLAAALLAGAALLLVSVSGAVLIFRPELEDAVFGGPVRVEPGLAALALTGLIIWLTRPRGRPSPSGPSPWPSPQRGEGKARNAST